MSDVGATRRRWQIEELIRRLRDAKAGDVVNLPEWVDPATDLWTDEQQLEYELVRQSKGLDSRRNRTRL